MQNQLEEFAKASKGALCNIFGNYGAELTRLAPYAYAGGPKVGTAATLGVALGNYAARNNCDWDPEVDSGQPDIGGTRDCAEVADGWGWWRVYEVYPDRTETKNKYSIYGVTKVEFVGTEYAGAGFFGDEYHAKFKVTYHNGPQAGETVETSHKCYPNPNNGEYPINWLYGIDVQEGTCRIEGTPNPGLQPPTYNHTTEEGCQLNVDFKGLIQDNDSNVHGVWQIAPTGTRASGGVIGGCNFYPTIYYDGGGSGGGGGTIPVPIPDPGGDWWKDKIGTALAGAAGNLLANAIRQLFEAKLPPAHFSFIAPCDKKEDGTPAEVIYEWDEQNYQSRVLSQQAVLMEMLQQHLNWKTPICYGNNQAGAYWRSITFESTTYSDDSNSRLVKRFRYRSNTPGDVRLLAQHWAGFSWNTGGVIVRHSGSALGSPKVWAASVDEGKRVIHHAGGEAGVDPDQVGEWSISSSNHPRYGVQRTVVLKQVDGCWMATARQGPDGWPEAASSFPDS